MKALGIAILLILFGTGIYYYAITRPHKLCGVKISGSEIKPKIGATHSARVNLRGQTKFPLHLSLSRLGFHSEEQQIVECKLNVGRIDTCIYQGDWYDSKMKFDLHASQGGSLSGLCVKVNFGTTRTIQGHMALLGSISLLVLYVIVALAIQLIRKLC